MADDRYAWAAVFGPAPDDGSTAEEREAALKTALRLAMAESGVSILWTGQCRLVGEIARVEEEIDKLYDAAIEGADTAAVRAERLNALCRIVQILAHQNLERIAQTEVLESRIRLLEETAARRPWWRRIFTR